MSDTPGYSKRYELDRLMGVDRSPVPAGPVREHLQGLLSQGMTPSSISRACGVSRTGIRDIAQGRTRTVRRPLAARIMRVNVTAVVDAASWPMAEVPSRGTVRRVRALLALGHTHAVIQAAAGCSATWRLSWSDPPVSVTKRVADGVERAYRALSMTPGASEHTRRRAARAGYVPPLGWDDIDTDAEPPAPPEGRVTLVDEVEWLARTGEDLEQAAARLGCTTASLDRMLRQRGRADLISTLRGAA